MLIAAATIAKLQYILGTHETTTQPLFSNRQHTAYQVIF